MIRPSDIQSKEFEIKMRGYDRDEVDDFLDEIIDDMKVLYKDNADLTNELKQVRDELAVLRAKQDEIQKSLELTRYQCEEMKKNARREAEAILSKAGENTDGASADISMEKQRLKDICTEVLEKLK